MTTRRRFLTALAGAASVGALAIAMRKNDVAMAEEFEITKTKDEWLKQLGPERYAVLREEDTERPFTSPLNDEKRKGTFNCAGCELPLYSSETKYDSGTGWPSFYAPIENAVATRTDYKLIYPRTEVHCRRCGGHLGHVFNDGPQPTGLRYCMNGLAMTFEPASQTG